MKKGFPRSEATKKKISKKKKGIRVSPDTEFKKGHKCSEEIKKKMSLASKGNPKSEKHRKAISKALTGKPKPWQVGNKHWNWKGGISSFMLQIRNCWKYKEWRSSVFERDNYTCQSCGDNKGHNLNAHHWKEFSKIIEKNNIITLEQALDCEELWSINNGITLCEKCHKDLHTNI
jgi:hypothetical protein